MGWLGRAPVAIRRGETRVEAVIVRLPQTTRISTGPAASGPQAWTAQAVQGSNEWTVRRISTGLAGSATGVPTSASSNAPRRPWASRGEPFQVVASTIW